MITVFLAFLSVTYYGGWLFAGVTIALFAALYKPVRFIHYLSLEKTTEHVECLVSVSGSSNQTSRVGHTRTCQCHLWRNSRWYSRHTRIWRTICVCVRITANSEHSNQRGSMEELYRPMAFQYVFSLWPSYCLIND